MHQSRTKTFDPVSRVFHWLTALLVLIAFILGPGGFGRLIDQGIDPATHSDIVWHESLGISVLALTILRLIWLALRPAAPQFQMALWMHRMAQIAHIALWALLLALPVTALLALGSQGNPLTLLGGVRVDQMPLIANSAVANLADWSNVHQLLGDVIMWLAGLHALAALYHHLVLKDGVLVSILPTRRLG